MNSSTIIYHSPQRYMRSAPDSENRAIAGLNYPQASPLLCQGLLIRLPGC
jgi:hypothetical protein